MRLMQDIIFFLKKKNHYDFPLYQKIYLSIAIASVIFLLIVDIILFRIFNIIDVFLSWMKVERIAVQKRKCIPNFLLSSSLFPYRDKPVLEQRALKHQMQSFVSELERQERESEQEIDNIKSQVRTNINEHIKELKSLDDKRKEYDEEQKDDDKQKR